MRAMIRRLILVLLALSPAACGRSEPDDGKIHVRYLASPDVGGFSKVIIERFERAHPDVKVDMVEGPAAGDARENMYSTAFMGKEDSYDLAYVDVAWVPKFAAQGWLRPLDELVAPERLRLEVIETIIWTSCMASAKSSPKRSSARWANIRSSRMPPVSLVRSP